MKTEQSSQSGLQSRTELESAALQNSSCSTNASGPTATAVLSSKHLVRPFRFPNTPYEYKITPLRECPVPDSMALCDTPDKAAEYWRMHIATHPYFNSECECLAVLLLNTRRRVKGHHLATIGTLDTLLVHPREVFRVAIAASASAIVIAHNHPSGVADPSEADIKVTRDLIRAGQLLKIEVLDHVIVGNPGRASLRELGYFHSV